MIGQASVAASRFTNSHPLSFLFVTMGQASEPEHREETACSLKFGERMTAVRNTAVKVVGTDFAKERARVMAAAKALRAKLRAMEAAGGGGGFVEGAPSSERVMLEENMEKLRLARRRCDRMRIEITEGGGTSRRGELEQRAEEARFQLEMLGDVVARQKSIKRLWREPSGPFRATQAEERSLTEQLGRLR